jgi:hypothetical protein
MVSVCRRTGKGGDSVIIPGVKIGRILPAEVVIIDEWEYVAPSDSGCPADFVDINWRDVGENKEA